MSTAEKQEEILRIAHSLLSTRPDWATFYREILGKDGVVRQMYPELQQQSEFDKTEAADEIRRILRDLREKGPAPAESVEPTKVITVRLPQSMHEALWEEAHQHRTSVNKLCVSKLMQLIDNSLVPPERK